VSIPSDADVEGLEYYFASNLAIGSSEEYRPTFDFAIRDPDKWETTPCADACTYGGLFVSRGWFSFQKVFSDLFVRKGVNLDLLLTPDLDGVEERDASPSERATVRCQANILKELDVLLDSGWHIASGCKHTLVIVGRAGGRDVRVEQDLVKKLARALSKYLSRIYNAEWSVILGCVPYGMDEGHNAEKRRLCIMGGPSIFDLTNELMSIKGDKLENRDIDVRVTSAFSVDWESWVDTCLNLDNPGIKVGVSV
jgi:hypothetical protein